MIVTLLVLGFLALVASRVVDSALTVWLAVIGYGLVAVAVAAGVWGRQRTPPPHASTEPSASDAYSDLELGRGSPTHYPQDVASASEIGAPPDRRGAWDPLAGNSRTDDTPPADRSEEPRGNDGRPG